MSSSEQIEAPPLPTPFPASAQFVEELYEKWKSDPESVSPDWRLFFMGFEMGQTRDGSDVAEAEHCQSQVDALIEAYRNQGHLVARFDPLNQEPAIHPRLQPKEFGLGPEHLDRVYESGLMGGPERASLREIIDILTRTYCGPIGVEYLHNQDFEVRQWLQQRMEPIRNQPDFERDVKLDILRALVDAEVLESFIQKRYPGQKRFSLEGGESLIAGLRGLIELAGELGVEEIVMGMAHRGRLNVLANVLKKPYSAIFSEFEDIDDPDWVDGDGDVKYHRGYTETYLTRKGESVKISLTANPSHLEAVDPVVQGRARAKQRRRNDTADRRRVVPLLIHGDAAFAGQGLVAETLNLSQLDGYRTGGTVHIIINNQIGFTTSPSEARSTHYSSDVAKVVGAPIFHVNGDDPEALVFAVQTALLFRQEFSMDVVIDMVCYRKHGHNEGDEPAFSHPQLYKKIRNHPSARKIYTQRLLECCALTEEEAEDIPRKLQSLLQDAFESAKQGQIERVSQAFEELWTGLDAPFSHDAAVTLVGLEDLKLAAKTLTGVPEGFRLNPKIARGLPTRLKAVEEGGMIDWPYAELLAFATLVSEGLPVRLSGQDSARGTFSQRHAVWQDMETEEPYVPIRNIHDRQATFCVYNSMLSEAAVLGFDYGYALSEPHMLVLWEAQFGDFANGAQVIIDQFIVCSQSKWQRTCGLVMLLPHGYEGQGPEHSNAYLERYLAACAEDNIQVCNLSTPANYFHALRRQLKRNFRRPLIIMSPKSLLRHKECVSPLEEFTGGRFQELIDDPDQPSKARRLVFCSGKIYYDLADAKRRGGSDDVALVRVEQLYPLHEDLLLKIAEGYSQAEDVIWAQEEPANRGGWSFMRPRLEQLLKRRILYAGRRASASPAVGSLAAHRREQAEILSWVFERPAGSEKKAGLAASMAE